MVKKQPLVRLIALSCLFLVTACSALTYSVLSDAVKAVQTLPAPLIPTAPVTPLPDARQVTCLARMVYGEARGEPFHGQVAAAAVAISRSKNPNWPKTLCAVVQEPKQFAGYWAAYDPPAGARSAAWEKSIAAANYAVLYYERLPASYRKVYFFTLRHEKSKFHAKLPLQGYIANHAFYRQLGS